MAAAHRRPFSAAGASNERRSLEKRRGKSSTIELLRISQNGALRSSAADRVKLPRTRSLPGIANAKAEAARASKTEVAPALGPLLVDGGRGRRALSRAPTFRDDSWPLNGRPRPASAAAAAGRRSHDGVAADEDRGIGLCQPKPMHAGRLSALAALNSGLSQDGDEPAESDVEALLDATLDLRGEESGGTSGGCGFEGDLIRVAGRVGEVREHFVGTRRELLKVAGTAEAEARFSEAVSAAQAEVRHAISAFGETCNCLRELASDTEAFSSEVEALIQSDRQMTELLRKCSRKLDGFVAALGNAPL